MQIRNNGRPRELAADGFSVWGMTLALIEEAFFALTLLVYSGVLVAGAVIFRLAIR